MFKRIDHIGIVVDDLAFAGRVLSTLGFTLVRSQDVPERGVRIAFYACGDGQIELIEPLTAEVRGARLGPGTSARLEHIGLEVEKVEPAMEALRALGVTLTHPEPVVVGPNRNNWTKASTTGGIQFQLVERGQA